MKRSTYFDYIEEKLMILSYRIKTRGKLNILNLNIHSEVFYTQLLNLLFDYSFVNLNALKQNAQGIDLIDRLNKVIVQVSSTCTKQKIEHSLSKLDTTTYLGYRYLFVALTGDGKELRSKMYPTIQGIEFTPLSDIYDVKSIVNIVLNLPLSKQKKLYNFINEELGPGADIIKIDSNLTEIITILSKEDLAIPYESPEINSFEIERKIEYNDLVSSASTIDDYKIFYSKINEKYTEFDKLGTNKSFSVLMTIRKLYTNLCKENDSSGQEIFFQVIDNLIELIIKSKNYNGIPYEEIELCASILVVDAFIKCKIFENPEGYNYVTT
ncbi:hypothetical protein BAU15_10545 [Enterococcus sp. JM4C]|uniref:ABC-three component system protein n=1 Tax=Candidatus Enterococcus huntleyi TaxID=1857217 RepID=UPI001379D574|nr:ABC-three component system protein [Enterococcus sp. JM4C]KAF1296216.1 hypothetical protein BAU15_10545 [Enterococcus sp. JM4C]